MRLRLQSLLNASLRCLDVIQVYIENINKSVLQDFVSLEKIEAGRQLCEKNRDCETHITAKKKRTVRPVKFDETFARPIVFEGPDLPPLN